MARINFPDSFAQQKALLTSINDKHVADGASSVLNPYFTEQGISSASDIAAGAQAEIHDTARSLYGKPRGYRQLRDNSFNPYRCTEVRGFCTGFPALVVRQSPPTT